MKKIMKRPVLLMFTVLMVLMLCSCGKEKDGIRGWRFKYGSTGIHSLGNGLFYISENSKNADGLQQTTLRLYRWTGDPDHAFIPEP